MRTRKEIEDKVDPPNINIELLLDIRELLAKIAAKGEFK